MEFDFDNLADGYYHVCRLTRKLGEPVQPRGYLTYELTDVTVTIQDPTDVLLTGCDREGYHPAIGATEGLLLVAGLSDPPLLRQVAPAFARFQDGGALHGAYGPRLRFQIPRVIDRLTADRDTRQAVAVVWDPLYDGAGDQEGDDQAPRDVPCTISLTFRVRNGALTLKTHMRSNDVWLGLPYDVIMFTILQQTVANVLDLPAGPYVHHVDSLHLYDRDLVVSRRVRVRETNAVPTRLHGLEASTWAEARRRASNLLYVEDSEPASHTDRWFDEMISPYRLRKD